MDSSGQQVASFDAGEKVDGGVPAEGVRSVQGLAGHGQDAGLDVSGIADQVAG